MGLISFLAAAGIGAGAVVVYQRTNAKKTSEKATKDEYIAEAKILADEVTEKAKEYAPVVSEKVKEAAPVVAEKAKEVAQKAKDTLNL